MPATVILNPYANRWEGERRSIDVEISLNKAGIDFVLHKTERPGHGTELARAAAEAGNFPLIAVGGDGSISEVVNGVMQATPPESYPAGPIGFIPLGTANDLTDVLSIPRDFDQAMKVITDGHTRLIDVGSVNGHFFDNNSAIGLEPMVTIENIRLTWLKGNIRYMVSAILAILKKPYWDVEMEWDDGSYNGTLSLVSVGNTHRTGGYFYMTPHASVNDGLLDFVFAPELSRMRMFQLLPKTQTGEHIDDPDVQEHQTTQLTIRTKTPTPIQADGELIAEAVTEIKYKVIPNALKIFTLQT